MISTIAEVREQHRFDLGALERYMREHVPGFALFTETAYSLVARNRRVASFFSRLLWGNDVRRPT